MDIEQLELMNNEKNNNIVKDHYTMSHSSENNINRLKEDAKQSAKEYETLSKQVYKLQEQRKEFENC